MKASKSEAPVTIKKDRMRFPFRLGTTSYIIPADIVPNVIALAERVDDIELVLFESESISNLPNRDTVNILRSVAKEHDLTYTVHFPLDIDLCSADERIRVSSIKQCGRIIDLVRPLYPFAFIIHCNEECGAHNPPADDIESWAGQARRSFRELAGMVDDPRVFAVETLGYPFHVLESLIRDCGVSVCLDIGHLIMKGYSLGDHWQTYRDITRVVHLHGIVNGKDHASLKGLDDNVLETLLTQMRSTSDTERVLTIEVFSESDFNDSCDILRKYTNG